MLFNLSFLNHFLSSCKIHPSCPLFLLIVYHHTSMDGSILHLTPDNHLAPLAASSLQMMITLKPLTFLHPLLHPLSHHHSLPAFCSNFLTCPLSSSNQLVWCSHVSNPLVSSSPSLSPTHKKLMQFAMQSLPTSMLCSSPSIFLCQCLRILSCFCESSFLCTSTTLTFKTTSPPISILYYGGYLELVIKGGFLGGITNMGW